MRAWELLLRCLVSTKKDGEWRFATLGEVIGQSANSLEDIANKYK